MGKINEEQSVVECEVNYKKIAEFIKKKMPEEFDSHEFIQLFIKKFPVSYGLMLIRYQDVTVTHSQLAIFLSNNAERLQIKRIPEQRKSNSIFEKKVPNACWKKINI